jgi:hypothetical protein
MNQLEKKIYTETSSPEEIALLKCQIQMLDNNIIYYDEAPILSTFQLDVYWGEIKRLIEQSNEPCYLLINLVNSEPPGAAERARLKHHAIPLKGKINYVSIYTERNKLINYVAKFVLGGVGFLESSIHSTKDQAIKAILDAQNR